MSYLEYLLEKQRKGLENLIEEKHCNLQHPDIISASQKLDIIIALYNMNKMLYKLLREA